MGQDLGYCALGGAAHAFEHLLQLGITHQRITQAVDKGTVRTKGGAQRQEVPLDVKNKNIPQVGERTRIW